MTETKQPLNQKQKLQLLLPIFDSSKFIEHQNDFSHLNPDVNDNGNYKIEDILKAKMFLSCYRGSVGTYNSYRNEIEHLIHWCALIAKKGLKDLRREDIEDFIKFCQKPPKQWIGTHKPPKFIEKDKIRVFNPVWKPFIVTVSKSEHQNGKKPDIKDFEYSQTAIKQLFAIVSSLYNYLLQEEYVFMNPVAMIRQKSKFIRKVQEKPKIRRLSELQWLYVIEKAKENADTQNNDYNERTLFIMSALYLMYLRVSELAASPRWTPKMNDFAFDGDNNFWFSTVGKGNKQRQIAVSDTMLEALKRWRKHLKLSPLPNASDVDPLIPKTIGSGAIRSATYVRKVVQRCFDEAIEDLKRDGFNDEAESLQVATVHWLRHTGISEDVKIRPREHVRDDAGHSSSAITDKYIDIELRERHKSAKKKLLT